MAARLRRDVPLAMLLARWVRPWELTTVWVISCHVISERPIGSTKCLVMPSMKPGWLFLGSILRWAMGLANWLVTGDITPKQSQL